MGQGIGNSQGVANSRRAINKHQIANFRVAMTEGGADLNEIAGEHLSVPDAACTASDGSISHCHFQRLWVFGIDISAVVLACPPLRSNPVSIVQLTNVLDFRDTDND
jgi:hypothetical protein